MARCGRRARPARPRRRCDSEPSARPRRPSWRSIRADRRRAGEGCRVKPCDATFLRAAEPRSCANMLSGMPSTDTVSLPFLLSVIRDLSLARDRDRVLEIIRTAARQVTSADGVTFVLRDGTQCYYADEDAIAPLWKGRRF